MFISSLFKWVLSIISTIVVLVVCALIIFLFMDKQPPINEHKKVCLVTGASSGIGREIARIMVKKGWQVIGIARQEQKLKDLERDLGESFIPYVCDVAKEEKIHEISENIRIKKLCPTLFFLNAGTGHADLKFKFSQKLHHDTFNTNYFGVTMWVQEWLDSVKTYGGGTFVATSSVNALYAMPGSASYSASKAAINSCFQALRLQYLNDNIGFFVVLPGPVDTDMLKGMAKKLPFIHNPADEASYIVEQVFAGNKQIEPSWLYAFISRLLNFIPDKFVIKNSTPYVG